MTEIFYEEELLSTITEVSDNDEWKKKVSELGLVGQEKLMQNASSPIPFMPLNTRQLNILEIMCPELSSLELYNSTPIPIQVLSAIALAKKENYFTEIIVRRDNIKPDPVVIGKIETAKYTHSSFLIARWGTEGKLSWPELEQEALKRAEKVIVDQAKEKIRFCESVINDPQLHANKKLNGQFWGL